MGGGGGLYMGIFGVGSEFDFTLAYRNRSSSLRSIVALLTMIQP
jgi:hypothetical protein